MAAQTGSSSAPTTPSVSGTSMIVTPSRVFTRSRRALPSSTSALIRSMTRSTPSSSMWNVSQSFSFAVGISLPLLDDDLKSATGVGVGEGEEPLALRGDGVPVSPPQRQEGLDAQRHPSALANDLPGRSDESVDEH